MPAKQMCTVFLNERAPATARAPRPPQPRLQPYPHAPCSPAHLGAAPAAAHLALGQQRQRLGARRRQRSLGRHSACATPSRATRGALTVVRAARHALACDAPSAVRHPSPIACLSPRSCSASPGAGGPAPFAAAASILTVITSRSSEYLRMKARSIQSFHVHRYAPYARAHGATAAPAVSPHPWPLEGAPCGRRHLPALAVRGRERPRNGRRALAPQFVRSGRPGVP